MPDAPLSTNSLGCLLTLAALATLAGCLGADPSEAVDATGETVDDLNPLTDAPTDADEPESETDSSYPRCQHPWPCGNRTEWPANLTGPFEIAGIERVNVTSFDGTTLHGWIVRPDVPEGVEVPVLLGSTPYAGQTSEYPGDPDNNFSAYAEEKYGVDLMALVEEGYAVAIFNVRGTGYSGGCFDVFGPKEQRDQVELVNWLGNRTWSNDRVGMIGRSYRAGTAWEAAVRSPEPLKTTVTAGIVTDWYTFYHTPQGVAYSGLVDGIIVNVLGPTTGPPVNDPDRHPTEWGSKAPERACPTTARWTGSPIANDYRDERDRGFWEPRRLVDDLSNVTAATLLTHGFHDSAGHGFQDSAVWQLLPDDTPKHLIEGTWDHQFPNRNDFREEWTLDDWNERLLDWLDFWLKGLGDPPDELGAVDYQDDQGNLHRTDAWPPSEAREEVLHLTPEGLSGTPGEGTRSFLSAPDEPSTSRARDDTWSNPGPICPLAPDVPGPKRFVSYVSEPLEEAAIVAGNPFAYLNVTSSLPGGLVQVSVLELGPDFACEAGDPNDVTWVTQGAADLRFHDGGYTGEAFPLDTPTRVRIDLIDNAAVLEPDHRLGVWLSFGDPIWRTSQPYTPQLTVHGDSEIVLPVVEGTLGGHAPDHEYPPRPFVPEG